MYMYTVYMYKNTHIYIYTHTYSYVQKDSQVHAGMCILKCYICILKYYIYTHIQLCTEGFTGARRHVADYPWPYKTRYCFFLLGLFCLILGLFCLILMWLTIHDPTNPGIVYKYVYMNMYTYTIYIWICVFIQYKCG